MTMNVRHKMREEHVNLTFSIEKHIDLDIAHIYYVGDINSLIVCSVSALDGRVDFIVIHACVWGRQIRIQVSFPSIVLTGSCV
jgi:hypothetical protein